METPRFEEPSYSYAGPGHSQSYPSASTIQPTLPKLPNYDLEPLEADAILTFNQTVDQVQAQGGRDLSRYPAVNELYDKASGLRPKLALSLDDTGRKEREIFTSIRSIKPLTTSAAEMLTDMHDKLSQAVKLYDQILTQQVSQPRWRTSNIPVSPAPYQQQPIYGQYSQWAPQQASQAGYQTSYDPQPEPPRSTYASPPPPVLNSAPEVSQTQYQQHSYQQHQQQPSQWTTSPVASTPSAPPQSPRYVQPQYQQYAVSVSAEAPHMDSVTYNQPSSTSAALQFAAPAPPPPTQPQSPEPPNQYQQHAFQAPPTQSTMIPSRQNTIAQPNYTSSPQQYHTLSQQTQQPQQGYQGAPQHSVPISLPQFPSAPTAIPQPSFPAYSSSISPGFEKKEERKEALLIDL